MEKAFKRQFTREEPEFKSPALAPGWHTGVVTGNLLPNQLVLVKPDGQDADIRCVWAAGIVSGLLGFKTSYLPPPDTRVGFIYTGRDLSYIIASYPTSVPVPLLERGITDPDLKTSDQQTHAVQRGPDSTVVASHNPPCDLMEGEINIDNAMGVGLSMLRYMASLQASDLARVECHLLDDLVRIISQNYRHHSSFGDFKISNDGGKLNVEWQGTSYDHEAWGVKEVRDPKVPLDQTKDNIKIDETVDGYLDEGRWRFTQYVGWLGDFIHMFVTDPVEQIGRLAADQLRGGKARLHINGDGSVLVQSVADIVLEKVVCIPVPIRIRREEDPEGNRSDEGLRHADELEQWKPSSQSNLFEMAFQLREYARWLNNKHAFARFRQMDRDYKVPKETETPNPLLNGSEKDKEQANQGINNWQLRYACYRIYRDGSVQHVDAYGNSYTSTKTGIQISSTQDILLQAAGSVNIVAGRDVNVLAQKNIGLTATKEQIRLRAKDGLMVLLDSGKFLVEFLKSGLTFLKNSTFNVDNVATVSTGKVDIVGNCSAVKFTALLTMIDGEPPHLGHIFNPFPPIPKIANEEFEFQSNYGSQPLYQTHAQSVLARNEQPSGGSWALASNAEGGRGAPWPGENPQEKATSGGSNLNQKSATEASAQPAAMTSRPVVLKTQ